MTAGCFAVAVFRVTGRRCGFCECAEACIDGFVVPVREVAGRRIDSQDKAGHLATVRHPDMAAGTGYAAVVTR